MWIVVKRGEGDHPILDKRESVPTYEQIVDGVGGWFATCANVRLRKGRAITFYCNDEGLILDLEPIVIAGSTLRTDMLPIAGQLVIVATDAEGETVAMTAEEVDAVVLEHCNFRTRNMRTGVVKSLGLLNYRGGE